MTYSGPEPPDPEDEVDPLSQTIDDIHDPSKWACGSHLSRSHRIVVAEDDADLRSLVVSLLRRDGYIVTEAANGAAVIEHLLSTMSDDSIDIPDLIVTDQRMPGCNGTDILHFVEHMRWYVPVVLITAFGDDDTHAQANDLGAEVVLDKPFSLTDLLAAVYNALEPIDSQRMSGRTPSA